MISIIIDIGECVGGRARVRGIEMRERDEGMVGGRGREREMREG